MEDKHTLTGIIQSHPQFESRILRNRRDVLVYLPPGYGRARRRRYPVLYLHDGQNVFDAATSFAGVEWGADEAAQRLIEKKLIEPLIIVAVANTGSQRIHEYAPTRGVIDSSARRKSRSRGWLRRYGRFLIEELKPFIDRTYRTRIDAGFDRTWRIVVRRIGHARARALVSARFQPARRALAVDLVGRMRCLPDGGRAADKAAAQNLARYRHARTGLGAGPGVARSVGRERLAALSRPPIYRSGGRRSQRSAPGRRVSRRCCGSCIRDCGPR